MIAEGRNHPYAPINLSGSVSLIKKKKKDGDHKKVVTEWGEFYFGPGVVNWVDVDGHKFDPDYQLHYEIACHHVLGNCAPWNLETVNYLERIDAWYKKQVRLENKANNEKKFGKGYSSDNSGDGPKGGNKPTLKGLGKAAARAALVQQLSNLVGKDVAQALYSASAKKLNPKKKPVGQKKQKVVSKIPIARAEGIRSVIQGGRILLSRYTSNYIRCFMDGFDERCKGSGIPRPGSSPSRKVTGFIRGTGYIGTNGFGFVYGMPTTANDRAAVGYSTAAYASTQIPQFASDVTIDTSVGSATSPAAALMSNLPYGNAALTSTTPGTIIESRIVSATLEAYYTGTVLNRSGQYYAYSDPDFDSLAGTAHNNATAPTGGMGVPELSAKEGCEIMDVSSKSRPKVVWVPPAANLNDYPQNNNTNLRKTYPYSQGQTQVDGNHTTPSAAICITGVAGQPFYWQMVVHAEYIGSGVSQSDMTESMSDVIAFDAVQCCLARAQRAAANDVNCNFNKCLIRELNKEGLVMTGGNGRRR